MVGTKVFLMVCCFVVSCQFASVLYSQDYIWLQDIKWYPLDSGFQSESSFFYNFIIEEPDSTYDISVDQDSSLVIQNELYFVFTEKLNGYIPEGELIFQNKIRDTTHLIYFKDGKLHGDMLMLKGADTLASSQYRFGLKHGLQFEKLANKVIKSEYEEGLLNGNYLEFRLEDGCLLKFVRYNKGKIDGLWQSNHDNGIVRLMLLYSLGEVVDGTYYRFFSDGSVRSILTFKGGELVDEHEIIDFSVD